MHALIRGHGKPAIVVGWILVCGGILASVGAVIVAITGETWFLFFLINCAMLIVGGWLLIHMGRKSRLEITPEGFIWSGPFGRPQSMSWSQVHRILLPPPGSARRLAAVAWLWDGRYVEIWALWISPTWPTRVFGADHRRAQQMLIEGHKAYLAQVRR